MSAWSDLSTAIRSAITGAGYVVPLAHEPEGWPSWAVGSFIGVRLSRAESMIDGSNAAMTPGTLTLTGLVGSAWDERVSADQADDLARALRALLETTAGLLSGAAQFVFESADITRIPSGLYTVAVAFRVFHHESY